MTFSSLPTSGFVRLKDLLRIIPISRSSWYAGIKEGRFPAPSKLGPRTAAWRVSDIAELLDRLSGKAEG